MATKVILSLTYGKDDKRRASFADFIPFAEVIQWGIDTFDLKEPVSAIVNGNSVGDVTKSLSELGIKGDDLVSFADANIKFDVPKADGKVKGK